MRALPATLITPLVFWACERSAVVDDVGYPDAQPSADAEPRDAGARDLGAGPMDAEVGEDAAAGMDATPNPDAAAPPDGGQPACNYPAHGQPNQMALNGVLYPYTWATAIDPMGVTRDLSMEQAHCDTDPDYAWGRAELLLFVSAPAW